MAQARKQKTSEDGEPPRTPTNSGGDGRDGLAGMRSPDDMEKKRWLLTQEQVLEKDTLHIAIPSTPVQHKTSRVGDQFQAKVPAIGKARPSREMGKPVPDKRVGEPGPSEEEALKISSGDARTHTHNVSLASHPMAVPSSTRTALLVRAHVPLLESHGPTLLPPRGTATVQRSAGLTAHKQAIVRDHTPLPHTQTLSSIKQQCSASPPPPPPKKHTHTHTHTQARSCSSLNPCPARLRNSLPCLPFEITVKEREFAKGLPRDATVDVHMEEEEEENVRRVAARPGLLDRSQRVRRRPQWLDGQNLYGIRRRTRGEDSSMPGEMMEDAEGTAVKDEAPSTGGGSKQPGGSLRGFRNKRSKGAASGSAANLQELVDDDSALSDEPMLQHWVLAPDRSTLSVTMVLDGVTYSGQLEVARPHIPRGVRRGRKPRRVVPLPPLPDEDSSPAGSMDQVTPALALPLPVPFKGRSIGRRLCAVLRLSPSNPPLSPA